MDEITPEQIQRLRNQFDEKVKSKGADFCAVDLERVKTDNRWIARFLAHTESNMEEATNMLFDTCQWRKEFGTNDLNESKLPARMFERGSLFIHNKDKWGKKLLIFKAKFHTKGMEEIELIQKFIVYFFERIERESQSDQISVIFDMKDTGWNNMDMDFVRYLITLLKQYYPFFVNYMVIYEMPWLLNAAWKIIKGWLPPKFVDRVKFLDKKTLKDFIDVDNQLAEWGGNDHYTYKFEPEVRSTKKANHLPNGVAPEPKSRLKSKAQTAGNSKPLHHRSEVDLRESTPSPILSINRPLMSSRSESNLQTAVDTHVLAEVDERIHFQPHETDAYIAHLRIRNIASASDPIIFKIKTTSPDKYRVRPTIGIVKTNGTATVAITTHPGVSAGVLPRDRFQVQVCRIPRDMPDFAAYENDAQINAQTNFSDINSSFREITEKSAVETYRLSCTVDARPNDRGSTSGSMIAVDNERMKQELDDLEKKISESVYRKLDRTLTTIKMLLYVITFLLTIVFLLNILQWWRWTPSNTALDQVLAAIKDLPHESCVSGVVKNALS